MTESKTIKDMQDRIDRLERQIAELEVLASDHPQLIKERLARQKSATLIDSIEPDKWDAWDASNENPTVVDSDGIDDQGKRRAHARAAERAANKVLSDPNKSKTAKVARGSALTQR